MTLWAGLIGFCYLVLWVMPGRAENVRAWLMRPFPKYHWGKGVSASSIDADRPSEKSPFSFDGDKESSSLKKRYSGSFFGPVNPDSKFYSVKYRPNNVSSSRGGRGVYADPNEMVYKNGLLEEINIENDILKKVREPDVLILDDFRKKA